MDILFIHNHISGVVRHITDQTNMIIVGLQLQPNVIDSKKTYILQYFL